MEPSYWEVAASHWKIVFDNFDYLLWGATNFSSVFPYIHNTGGLLTSLTLAVMGIFGAFWIGLAAGLGRLSSNKFLKIPCVIYIECIRGVPLLMLVFWFFFLMPVLLGFPLPPYWASLVAFIIFTSAYIGEIVKAGVKALPRGQMEAARGSGLDHIQAMRYIILPQALRNMIPSFVNQFVSLTKDTSLAYVIGVLELSRTALQVDGREGGKATAELWLTVGIIYFIVCYALTSYSRRMEKQLSRYQARDR